MHPGTPVCRWPQPTAQHLRRRLKSESLVLTLRPSCFSLLASTPCGQDLSQAIENTVKLAPGQKERKRSTFIHDIAGPRVPGFDSLSPPGTVTAALVEALVGTVHRSCFCGFRRSTCQHARLVQRVGAAGQVSPAPAGVGRPLARGREGGRGCHRTPVKCFIHSVT